MRSISTIGLGAASLWACVANAAKPIVADGKHFALNGDNMSYLFHVNGTGELLTDHYGGPADSGGIEAEIDVHVWLNLQSRVRREFPDRGRGDWRIPAVLLHEAEGSTVSRLLYQSHDIMEGKPSLPGLPSTFGEDDEVSTLIVHLYDNVSSIAADLSYSVFPKYDAIARSVSITNHGNATLQIEKLSSFSMDLPVQDLDMIELQGDWARETHRLRRHIESGQQGFESAVGYSSHIHNPFVAVVDREATETAGEVWGFSLIWTGSFSVDIEKGSQGLTRTQIGLNPYQLMWDLGPGETFTTPEAVSVYSSTGIGDMSRKYHKLYRKHLIKSKFVDQPRPPLFNTFAAVGLDYNSSVLYNLASGAAELGFQLFVLDGGWFGDKYRRTNTEGGLGDWRPDPLRFPEGFENFTDAVTDLKVGNSSTNVTFGLWFEPEMVNINSTLWEHHPDWALTAGDYPPDLTRSQLVLNLALPEVQQFVIDSISHMIDTNPITYIKWDNNKGINDTPSPMNNYKYMIGLYHVFQTLIDKYPDVIWNGCASGGGRFDPGILQYFPVVWASDDTDAVERLPIQFGASLVYPPSTIDSHFAAVPNYATGRIVDIVYRARVAMMGGHFGMQLKPETLTETERAQVPALVDEAKKVQPLVIEGEFYRLNLPEESDYPAGMYVAEDGSQAVVFAFSTKATVNHRYPQIRLQGLEPSAKYSVNGEQTLSGATLMNVGVGYAFVGDYDSQMWWLERQ